MPNPDSNAPNATPLRLAILADDLTGACDAAAAFAQRGVHAEAAISQGAAPSAKCEVWAVSTESRDIEVPLVEQRLDETLRRLPPARMLFKKIDSVFRGNTFAEIRAMAARHPRTPILLAPAFPDAGRTLVEGVLHVRDIAGYRTLSVLESLRAQGMDVEPLRAATSDFELRSQMLAALRRSSPVFLCDAGTQRELEVVARAAQGLAEPPLWIGSAGLAHALASVLHGGGSWNHLAPQRAERAEAHTLLFFIGSHHAVTRQQVEQLQAQHGANPRVRLITVPREERARELVLNVMQGMSPAEVGCLYVTGGDTAALVFDALGIARLRLVEEFAPGLPHAMAVGGEWDGMPVLLKSGGFGTANVLCEIATRFATARAGMPTEGSARWS